MIVTVLLFVLGLILLIKGGDWFVDGATSVARKFNVPDILIGATVVSIGTTLPEVMVSTTSALTGHGDIAYGNAIGSIICNTALIAAITIAVVPSVVDRKSLRLPMTFFYIAAAIYVIIAATTGRFSRLIGVLFLLMFVVYIVLSVMAARSGQHAAEEEDDNDEVLPLWKTIVYIVLGAICIAVGANLLVEKGTLIAEGLGVPESVIALTMVALGTSLPELVTAITSVIKGRGLISLGNIIGANLFNLVLVNGMASAASPYLIPNNSTIAGVNSTLIVDMPVMLLVMSILVVPGYIKGRVSRWQGVLLLCIYAGFCIYQFTM